MPDVDSNVWWDQPKITNCWKSTASEYKLDCTRPPVRLIPATTEELKALQRLFTQEPDVVHAWRACINPAMALQGINVVDFPPLFVFQNRTHPHLSKTVSLGPCAGYDDKEEGSYRFDVFSMRYTSAQTYNLQKL